MTWAGTTVTRPARFVLAWTVLAVVAATALAVVGTAPAAADQHEPENAPTFNDANPKVTFEITLPDRTDHYPGDHPVHGGSNGYNASIEYAAAGEEAFADFDAEDGIWIDFIEIGASWIDYSECDATQNTKVFGIDRGNDNDGTQADEDLIEHRKGSTLSAGGLTITFFDWGDLSGDPPYLAPPDAIVAAQGADSNDGPCLKMTSDPGWYRVRAYANGTIASECTEEGNSECEPDDEQWRGVNLNSNYVYICECDSEQEARETLGPPPNEADGSASGSDDGGGDGATPTPRPANTPTPTPEPVGTPTATAPPGTATPARATARDGTTQQPAGDQQSGGAQQASRDQQAGGQVDAQQPGETQRVDRGTPTIAEAPGFSPVAALGALLAGALLGWRRP